VSFLTFTLPSLSPARCGGSQRAAGSGSVAVWG